MGWLRDLWALRLGLQSRSAAPLASLGHSFMIYAFVLRMGVAFEKLRGSHLQQARGPWRNVRNTWLLTYVGMCYTNCF